MKKEYKEELKQAFNLLNCIDKESRLLGLGIFSTSKWVQEIRKKPDYEELYIQDAIVNYPDEYQWLPDFIDDVTLDDNDIEVKLQSCSAVEDFLRCLLQEESRIVKIVIDKDFS